MPKEWRYWSHDECLHCGGSVEVFTDVPDGLLSEDDEARCIECGCPGTVGLQDDYDNETGYTAYISWHDELGCDCAWCKAHPVE